MYLPMSRADFMGVQDDLVDVQLNSGDQLKKGPLFLRHLFPTPQEEGFCTACLPAEVKQG